MSTDNTWQRIAELEAKLTHAKLIIGAVGEQAWTKYVPEEALQRIRLLLPVEELPEPSMNENVLNVTLERMRKLSAKVKAQAAVIEKVQAVYERRRTLPPERDPNWPLWTEIGVALASPTGEATVCNWHDPRSGEPLAYCDLAQGHEGNHYFHSPRRSGDRVVPVVWPSPTGEAT